MTKTLGDFEGLTLLITGSSSGLGAAAAVAAARRGARGVIVNYNSSAAEAEQVADETRAAGAEVKVVKANVAEDADCRALADAAAPWGGLDVLINNAGMTKFAPNHADLDALEADDFLRIYRLNVVGAYQMTRACRPLLEAAAKAISRPSAVVNVSSIAALNGTGSSVAYAASKGALNTMTLSLARALAPLIRVNALCPGLIDTPWFLKAPNGAENAAKMREWAKRDIPLRVASTAEDVADSLLFLASPHSRNMTGERVESDAGFHLITPTPHKDAR
jgi:3-oxoacyl-[acyl-carrier protein] reductase